MRIGWKIKHIPCADRIYSVLKMCDRVVQRKTDGIADLIWGSGKTSLQNEILTEPEALLVVSQTKWEGRISIHTEALNGERKTHSRQNTWREGNRRLDGKTSFKLL